MRALSVRENGRFLLVQNVVHRAEREQTLEGDTNRKIPGSRYTEPLYLSLSARYELVYLMRFFVSLYILCFMLFKGQQARGDVRKRLSLSFFNEAEMKQIGHIQQRPLASSAASGRHPPGSASPAGGTADDGPAPDSASGSERRPNSRGGVGSSGPAGSGGAHSPGLIGAGGVEGGG